MWNLKGDGTAPKAGTFLPRPQPPNTPTSLPYQCLLAKHSLPCPASPGPEGLCVVLQGAPTPLLRVLQPPGLAST